MRKWSAPSLPPRWTQPGQPPFVARAEEIAALEAVWAEVLGGAGRAVFIGGAPGVGKSRLVSTVCGSLHSTGAAVLVGTCVPEFGAPFEPFDQPIREVLPAFRNHAVEPGFDESLEFVARTFTGSQHRTGPAVGQGRLYDAVVEVLRAAARIRPIVLVLEDLHWADVTALRLLTRIAAGTVDSRVLLLGTMRNTAPDRSDILHDAIADLQRLEGLRRIGLAPLTTEDITEYVSRCSGMTSAAARAPAEVLSDLTGGNPFLLRETWRYVVEANGWHEAGPGERIVEIPDTIPDMLRSRISTLDAPQLAVLELAAVLGEEVDLRELLAASDAPARVTLSAIDTAVRAGLLEPPRTANEGHHFPHAIARQALIDQVSAAQVIRLHARIAQTLETRFPAAPRLVQRLAHHYTAARALGFGDRAVTYLTRAAELAEGHLAHEDAGRWFERAADIALDATERDSLRLRAARNWTLTANFARSRT